MRFFLLFIPDLIIYTASIAKYIGEDMAENPQNESSDNLSVEGLRKRGKIIYVLQLISFLLAVTYLIAPLLAYVYLPESEGTWMKSHFKWQMNTFWMSMLVALVGLAFIPHYSAFFLLMASAIWIIYRVIKGWRYLNRGEAVPGYLY
jgi:uncharacterized membrane protein